jgi:3'(2'), 5'-bisphosphate nucleotidase
VLGLRATGRWQGDALADVGDQRRKGCCKGSCAAVTRKTVSSAEETADSPARLALRRVWIIDPLDGTLRVQRAARRLGRARRADARRSHGPAAVALPAQGRLIWGVSRPGFECAGLEGPGQLVRGDARSAPRPRIAVSRSHTPSWMRVVLRAALADLVPSGQRRQQGRAAAPGRGDLYAHRKGLKEWDTCAPECVARALGWWVGRLRGDEHALQPARSAHRRVVVCRPAERERVLHGLLTSGAVTHS